MMRPLAAITAFLLTTCWALAEDITVSPKLRAGDQFRLELTRSRENSSRPQQNGTTRTVVDVRVISATTTGFVLDWTPGATVFDNPRAAQDPLVGAASAAIREIQFRNILDADGKFAGLANKAEVEPKLQAMVDVMLRELSRRVPAEQRKALQDIGQVLSPATLIASATREVEMYFGLQGVGLPPGGVAEATIQVPNPLGGGEIPARSACIWNRQHPPLHR
jgi:hypothetical protein